MKSIDCIGKKFGKLTVVDIERKPIKHINSNDYHKNRIYFKCKCDCGNEKFVIAQNIKRGSTTSCGCVNNSIHLKNKEAKENRKIAFNKQIAESDEKAKSFLNKKFGRLIVNRIYRSDKKQIGKTTGRLMCECKCDCGSIINAQLYNIIHNHTNSCGCSKIYKHPANIGIGRLFENYKHKARRAKKEFALTKEEFKHITSSNCYYCGSKPSRIIKYLSKRSEYIYNGIDKINPNKGYTIDNVVPCCWECNQMKFDLPVDVFLNRIIKIYNKIIKQNIKAA